VVDSRTPNSSDDLRIPQVNMMIREQVVEVMRSAIASGRFKPGERLKERMLCEMTGVSRTSVREALRTLESEGLIRVIHNKGPIVATLTIEEASKIYEVRAALEGMAGRLLAEKGSTEDFRMLEVALVDLKAAYEEQDGVALSDATTRFYDVFLERCGNDIAASMIKSLNARVIYLRTQSIKQPGRIAKSIEEIERVVGAILRRDPDGARLLCEDHVRHARSAALAELERMLKSAQT